MILALWGAEDNCVSLKSAWLLQRILLVKKATKEIKSALYNFYHVADQSLSVLMPNPHQLWNELIPLNFLTYSTYSRLNTKNHSHLHTQHKSRTWQNRLLLLMGIQSGATLWGNLAMLQGLNMSFTMTKINKNKSRKLKKLFLTENIPLYQNVHQTFGMKVNNCLNKQVRKNEYWNRTIGIKFLKY